MIGSKIKVLMGVVMVGLMAAGAANAADLRIKCEVRDDRSRASVDGRDLDAGVYLAIINNGVSDVRAAAPVEVVGQQDEAEFDFDSNPNDIADGATGIAIDFLGGSVIARLVSVDNGEETPVAMGMADCRDRR